MAEHNQQIHYTSSQRHTTPEQETMASTLNRNTVHAFTAQE